MKSIGVLIVLVALASRCTADICPGEVAPPPTDACGVFNISSASMWNSTRGTDRHKIESVSCLSPFAFGITMPCVPLDVFFEMCEDATSTCVPCATVLCWSHSSDGWTTEAECVPYNRSGTQHIRGTFYTGTSQNLHVFVPGTCTQLAEPSPAAPAVVPEALPPFPSSIPCDTTSDLIIFPNRSETHVGCDTGFAVELVSNCRVDEASLRVCNKSLGICSDCARSNIQLIDFSRTNITFYCPPIYMEDIATLTYSAEGVQQVRDLPLGPCDCNPAMDLFLSTPSPNITCGAIVEFLYLNNNGFRCPYWTSMTVCDANLEFCESCSLLHHQHDLDVFICQALATSGLQIFNASYSLGDLSGGSNVTANVSCPSPAPVPLSNPISPPIAQPVGVPCASSTVYFVAESPSLLHCGGGTLVFNLSSSSGCSLSAGGILVCDFQRRNCIPFTFTVSQPHGPVVWDMQSTPAIDLLRGPLVVTATYQLGPFIGTVSTAVSKDVCSPSPVSPSL